MKPPGWLVIAPGKPRLSEDGRSAVFDIRVRLWHPGFWLAWLGYKWRHRGQ